MKLFPYALRYDDGAAPNPFWGVCTLAIRKPSVRLAADVDDWIVGIGSVDSPLGDISDSLVYAMKVTSKLTLEEYDQFCRTFLPRKLPDWRHRDHRVRMGDCVYNFVGSRTPKMRASIHSEENQIKDLAGKYSLVSKQFYYFGNHPVKLPGHLFSLLQAGQGHGFQSDLGTVDLFISWIENLESRPNKVLGEPQRKTEYSREKEIRAIASARDLMDDS